MVVGGHAWLWGGMCGCGGHAWLWGGVHGCRGHAWLQGVCVVVGGMHGCRGVCVVAGGAFMGYDEIRSMSGRYASYWNAFLLIMHMYLLVLQVLICDIFSNTI